jgi:hypothetical protein
MKKAITLLGVAILAAISLTGCIGNGSVANKDTNGGAFTEFTYQHSNGKSMNCLRFDKGITCDWAGATTKGKN